MPYAFGSRDRAALAAAVERASSPLRGGASRTVRALLAVLGGASAIALASCGGSRGAAGGAGGATSVAGAGANGGDDLPAGGGWMQPPVCGGSGGASSSASNGGASAGSGGSAGAIAGGSAGAIAGGSAGASEGAGGASASAGCDGVGGGAHFAKDVGPILAACTGELCHLPPGYADLVNVPATECCDGRLLVAPFDAAHSYVLDKVKGVNLCYGGRMPFDAPALSDADTQTIARWICEGAPDD